MSDFSSTYVREMRPEIHVSFCDMNLWTRILFSSSHLRKVRAYALVVTILDFCLFG
jgi:hypothetical protein